MPIPQIFKVATEFKFEIGSAILGANQLKSAVDGISASADNAILSMKGMGISAALNLGFGSTSLLGIAGKAIFAFDKLQDQSLKFSTVMAANKDRLVGPIDSFNDRMIIATSMMKTLAGDAAKFSLDENALVGSFNLVNAQLLSKGLAGTNFEQSRSLSRNFLKATPFLGINAGEAQGQLLRSVGGAASSGDPLFRRLSGETQAMKQFVGQTKKFNQLKPAERVKTLITALQEFTSQTDEITARTMTLTGSLTTFRNVIGGIDGVLIPVGQVLQKTIVNIIRQATSVINVEGRAIFQNLSTLIKPFAEDLEGTIKTLLQLRSLKGDVEDASRGLATVGIASGIGGLVNKLFATKFALGSIFGALSGGLFVFGHAMNKAGIEVGSFISVITKLGAILFGGAILHFFGLLIPIMAGLGSLLAIIIPPLIAFVALFQIFSRAVAIAKISDAKQMPELLVKSTKLMVRFSTVLGKLTKPFRDLFDGIAEFISPIFTRAGIFRETLDLFSTFIDLLEGLSNVLLIASSGVGGIIEAFAKMFENLSEGNLLFAGQGMGKAFEKGFFDMMAFQNGQGTDSLNTSNNVTNIGKVEIKNEFKENMQPDRIAFSLKEQLLKTAQAPTSARGRSFTKANAGGGF